MVHSVYEPASWGVVVMDPAERPDDCNQEAVDRIIDDLDEASAQVRASLSVLGEVEQLSTHIAQRRAELAAVADKLDYRHPITPREAHDARLMLEASIEL